MLRVFITGIAVQDGLQPAELLLVKVYKVAGIVWRYSVEVVDQINHVVDRVKLYRADLLDQISLIDTIEAFQPDEAHNLAVRAEIDSSKFRTVTGWHSETGRRKTVRDILEH